MKEHAKRLWPLGLGILGWVLVVVLATNSSDGYQFEGKEFQLEQMKLTVEIYSDQNELAAAAERVGLREQTDAFASVRPSDENCTIHILDPSTNPWEPATIGHEIAHCIWGDYHPSQKFAHDRAVADGRTAPEPD